MQRNIIPSLLSVLVLFGCSDRKELLFVEGACLEQFASAGLDEEHEALRAQVRRFVDEQVRPYGDQWEEDGKVPRELLRSMGDLGLFGIITPTELGGVGMGMMGLVVLAEELGRSTFGGVTVTVMVHAAMASPHLLHAGNEEQLQRFLPGILNGERITAITVSEPDAGSDVSALRTQARREGDRRIQLLGHDRLQQAAADRQVGVAERLGAGLCEPESDEVRPAAHAAVGQLVADPFGEAVADRHQAGERMRHAPSSPQDVRPCSHSRCTGELGA